MPPPVGMPGASEMERLFRCGTQVTGSLELGDHGFTVHFVLPDDAHDDRSQSELRQATRSFLQAISESLPMLGAIVPAQPTGLAAKWDTRTEARKEAGGDKAMTLVTVLHHRLARVDGEIATTSFAGTMQAGPTTFGTEVIEVRGSLDGEVEFHERACLPTRLTMRSTIDTSTGSGPMKMRIELTMEAADVNKQASPSSK